MPLSDQVNMFYNAKPHIFEKAKALRANMTLAEKLLWERMNDKKILGLRFRPQHPIDIFIADFYCHPLKLVIEIDGEIHNNSEQKQYDIGREAELKEMGIEVIRFTNDQIIHNIEDVLNTINIYCKQKLEEINNASNTI